LGRFTPRRFTPSARWRFGRARRAEYLGRLAGEPTPWQAATIDGLMRLEWEALAAEAEGGLTAYREGRELRRMFQRLLADFERSIPPPAAERPLSAAEALALIGDRLGRNEAA
jgi:hypothetical protein